MSLELDETERLVLAAWLAIKPLGSCSGTTDDRLRFYKVYRALCSMVSTMSLLERLAAATDRADKADAIQPARESAREPTSQDVYDKALEAYLPSQDVYDKALEAYLLEWNCGVRDEGRFARLAALEQTVWAAIVPGVVERPC